MFKRSESRESDWTLSTLFTYFRDRIEAERTLVEQHFDSLNEKIERARTTSEAAIAKAEVATEKRFESVNEFRQTLSDQTGTFISRNESNAALVALTQQVNDLKDRLNTGEGRQTGGSQTWVWIIAGVGAVGAITSLLVNVLGIATRPWGITH